MSRPDENDRVLRASERLYRALIAAYPREFRREYGPQMRQVFRDLCREERRKYQKRGLVRLWVRTILDLATTAIVGRISGLGRSSSKEVSVNDYKLAGLGFALLLAPLFFVSASLLKYGLGIGFLFDPLEYFLSEPGRRYVFNIISPIAFLGGLGLAVAANLYAVLRLNVGREDGAVVSTVRLEVKVANIAVILVSLALLVTLVGYAFLENVTYRY
jgi:hypothetical protein